MSGRCRDPVAIFSARTFVRLTHRPITEAAIAARFPWNHRHSVPKNRMCFPKIASVFKKRCMRICRTRHSIVVQSSTLEVVADAEAKAEYLVHPTPPINCRWIICSAPQQMMLHEITSGQLPHKWCYLPWTTGSQNLVYIASRSVHVEFNHSFQQACSVHWPSSWVLLHGWPLLSVFPGGSYLIVIISTFRS